MERKTGVYLSLMDWSVPAHWGPRSCSCPCSQRAPKSPGLYLAPALFAVQRVCLLCVALLQRFRDFSSTSNSAELQSPCGSPFPLRKFQSSLQAVGTKGCLNPWLSVGREAGMGGGQDCHRLSPRKSLPPMPGCCRRSGSSWSQMPGFSMGPSLPSCLPHITSPGRLKPSGVL